MRKKKSFSSFNFFFWFYLLSQSIYSSCSTSRDSLCSASRDLGNNLFCCSFHIKTSSILISFHVKRCNMLGNLNFHISVIFAKNLSKRKQKAVTNNETNRIHRMTKFLCYFQANRSIKAPLGRRKKFLKRSSPVGRHLRSKRDHNIVYTIMRTALAYTHK